MSKQKTFFTSRELPHIWAHQSAPEGRCASSETFHGKIYFSYATAIAQLVEGKNGEPGVIINNTGYSVTTAKHQSGVRGAVSHIENKFSVDDIRQGAYQLPTGRDLVEHYLKAFEHIPEWYNPETNKIEPYVSRYAHKRAEAFLHKVSHLEQAIRAAKFFGLPHKALEKKLAKLQSEVNKSTEIIEANKLKREAAQVYRYAKEREKNEARVQAWLADDRAKTTFTSSYTLSAELAKAVEEKNRRVQADSIEQWKAGAPIHGLRGCGVFLRKVPVVNSGFSASEIFTEKEPIVETSLGARFPLSHAERAFKLVQRCRKNHSFYHRNGHAEHVGAYALDEITPEGHVRAGCHVINWDEIEDFAKREGWITQDRITLVPDEGSEPLPEVKIASGLLPQAPSTHDPNGISVEPS